MCEKLWCPSKCQSIIPSSLLLSAPACLCTTGSLRLHQDTLKVPGNQHADTSHALGFHIENFQTVTVWNCVQNPNAIPGKDPSKRKSCRARRKDTQREREREGEIFDLLVHSPNGWSRTSLKPGTMSFFLSLPRGYRVLRFWTIRHCFPGPLAGNPMGSGTAWTCTVTHMGCWCCRLRIKCLSHLIGPECECLNC